MFNKSKKESQIMDKLKKDIFKYIDKLIDHGNSDNSDFDVNIHLEDDLKNEIKFLFQKYQQPKKEGN